MNQDIRKKAREVVAGARGIIKAAAPYLDGEADSFVWVWVDGIGDTFACDEARRIYADPAYVVKVGVGTVAADFLHEIVVHTMGDHFKRQRAVGVPEAHSKLWNIAGDAAGNHIVREIAALSMGRITPGGIRINPGTQVDDFAKSQWVTAHGLNLEEGTTVEAMYFELAERESKKQEQPKGDKSQSQGDKSQGQKGQKGQSQSQSQGESDGESDGDGEGQGQGQGGGKPKASPINPTLPPGMKPKACGGCAGDKRMTDELREKAKAQGESIPDERSPIELEGIRQATAQKIKAAADGRGNVPGGIKRWADDVLAPPKVDWRRELPNLVKRGVSLAKGKVDFTFAKTRKRAGVINPTMASFKPRVAMVFDTSGSMSDADITNSIVEGVGLVRKGGVDEAWIIACDTAPTKPAKMKGLSGKSIKEVLAGGGGTDMGAGIRAAAKVKPHVTVVFTDLDTGWPTEKPVGAGEVIIVGVRKSNCPTPEWARKVLDASK